MKHAPANTPATPANRRRFSLTAGPKTGKFKLVIFFTSKPLGSRSVCLEPPKTVIARAALALYVFAVPATTIAPQSEFEYKVDERDWSAVKLLVEELEQELAQRRNHLLFRITAWYFANKVFKRVESEKMVLKTPSERDSKYHRAMLAFLRGCGEVLIVELGNHTEIDPQRIGISYANFSAMVEDLRMSERQWYGDMTSSRRAEILNDVFGTAMTSSAKSPLE